MTTDRVAFEPSLETLLRDVGRAAEEAGERAWVVGGVVRDALLGTPNKDVDVTVEGDISALVRRLRRQWDATLEQETQFSTATLIRPDGFDVDLVRARREIYEYPGALPTVFPSDLRDDLERRDFTVNAIAASLGQQDFGAIVDPLFGRRDLRDGVLRIMHPQSFLDDPTRLTRAARYAVRYQLAPDAETDAAAVTAIAAGALHTVSADRRRREIEIICAEHRWAPMLCWLNRWRYWEALAPWEPHALTLRRADVVYAWATRVVRETFPPLEEFHWYALLGMAPDSLYPALSVKPAEAEVAARAHRVVASLERAETGHWQRAMDMESITVLLLALALAGTDGDKRRLTEYLTRTRPVRPSITGDDLIAAGARPGPALGLALRETLDAVRAGFISGREAELSFALDVWNRGEARKAGTDDAV